MDLFNKAAWDVANHLNRSPRCLLNSLQLWSYRKQKTSELRLLKTTATNLCLMTSWNGFKVQQHCEHGGTDVCGCGLSRSNVNAIIIAENGLHSHSTKRPSVLGETRGVNSAGKQTEE